MTIHATCRHCHAVVLVGSNAFLKITRSYYLPAKIGSYKLSSIGATGQPRPAYGGTDLSGCQIQPLCCTSCQETLGIYCTDAPTSKAHFISREFFKVSKLRLVDGNTGLEVEPQLEQDMVEERRFDAAYIGGKADSETRQVGTPRMSRDSLLPPPLPDSVQPRQPSPIQLPSLSHQHPQPQDGFVSQLQSSLQSQLHVHSQILEEQRQELESQRHHLARIDGAMEALHREQRNIFAMIDEVRHELRGRVPAAERSDMAELDILTEQVQTIGAKANEITGLKMQLEILRSQLRRIERQGSPALNGPVEPQAHESSLPVHVAPKVAGFVTNTPAAPEKRSAPLYQTPNESRLPAPILANQDMAEPRVASEPCVLPGFNSLPSWRPASSVAPPHPTHSVTSSPQVESRTIGSGWAAVNSNAAAPKRMASDSAQQYESPIPASPKRQRLAPLMPRASYDAPNPTGASSPYHPGSATDSLPVVPTLAGARNPSNESAGSIPPLGNSLRFVQFASGSEASPDESWRQDAAMHGTERNRGSPRRGRGGGRGRGGRKSGGGDGDRATPEYDNHPDSYYSAARGEVVRRGGHSGPPSDHHPGDSSAQAAGMYPDPHFMPITTTADVASSSQPTKKTRTKPVRNSEGILIRKDGRPDMRSVSSAMNLKKVHAKKEAERAGGNKETSATSEEPRDLSASEHDGGEMSATGSPSASSAHAHDSVSSSHAHDMELSSKDLRHQETMRLVFPNGVPDSGTGTGPSVAQQFFPKPDDIRPPPEVKVEAMAIAMMRNDENRNSEKEQQQQQHENENSMPIIDGEKSMVHHDGEGHVDVEIMDEAE